jgi:hypothetical protein
VAGIVRGGINYQKGQDVDEVDVILSVVGLAAVAASPPSGGTSLTVKVGAGLAKLMNSVGALPKQIQVIFIKGFREGIYWDRLGRVRGLGDLRSLVRPKVLEETIAVISNLGKIGVKLSPDEAIYLVRQVESAEELRAVSRATTALGARASGAMAVLGKNRFIRLTMRWSDEFRGTIVGLTAMFGALLALFWSGLTTITLRSLRRLVRKP